MTGILSLGYFYYKYQGSADALLLFLPSRAESNQVKQSSPPSSPLIIALLSPLGRPAYFKENRNRKAAPFPCFCVILISAPDPGFSK